jgi:hypothetical protein
MCVIAPEFMELMGRVRQTCVGIQAAIAEIRRKTQDGDRNAANGLLARLREQIIDGQTNIAIFHTALNRQLDFEEQKSDRG